MWDLPAMYPEITYFSDDNLKKNHKIFEKHIEFFSLNTKIKYSIILYHFQHSMKPRLFVQY